MKSQQNPGSIPIPKGDTKVENPDGVTRTYDNGETQRNSAWDAQWMGGGMSSGAFPYEGDDRFGWATPVMPERKRESTKRKDDEK